MKTVCAFQVKEGQDFWWGGRKHFRAYCAGPRTTGHGIYYIELGDRLKNYSNNYQGFFLGWNAKVEVD